jgi:hydrogenase/urease accessory protein HupE
MAHTGVGAAGGFAHGFWHPITGLDHVLAMVLVGVLAWQLGGRALWLVPATFVLVMAAGGVLAVAGVGLPLVELGIALSVVVLGRRWRSASARRSRSRWGSPACSRSSTAMPMGPRCREMRAGSSTA